jgi:transcription elongation factor GreA
MGTYYITKNKFLELRKKLAFMEKDYRDYAEDELAKAVDFGDIRENAEFDSAVWRQNHMAALISELRFVLSSHIVLIDEMKLNLKTVTIGVKVTLKNTNLNTMEAYTILGPQESDINNNIVSHLSPFAKFLIRKKIGDRVIIENFYYEIVKIEKAEIE